MNIKDFLETRENRRPYRGPVANLQRLVGTSYAPAYEVAWCMYTPLPFKFLQYIDEDHYNSYVLETRLAFGELFDYPPFSSFSDLTLYYDTSLQELGKCLCLQRGLMQAYDKSLSKKFPIARKEVILAMTTAFGPEYAMSLASPKRLELS